MTSYYTNRTDSWVIAINNNIVTGETYKAKDYIKSGLGGRWDADRKVWIINPDKLAAAIKSSTGLYDASDEQIANVFPAAVAKTTAQPIIDMDNYVPTIEEIEAFDRRMNRPNSDL